MPNDHDLSESRDVVFLPRQVLSECPLIGQRKRRGQEGYCDGAGWSEES